MDILDPEHEIPYRLFREKCIFQENGYIKDLKELGRNLESTIIIDNSPFSYALQKENALPIKSWYDDCNDVELYNYIPILELISRSENPLEIVSQIVVNGQLSYQCTALVLKREREIRECKIQTNMHASRNIKSVNIKKEEIKKPRIDCKIEVQHNKANEIKKLLDKINAFTSHPENKKINILLDPIKVIKVSQHP